MNTTGNYITNQGELILDQADEKVIGRYSKAGILEGTVTGNIVAGIWKNSGKEGLFEFVFSEDFSFKGKYKVGTQPGAMLAKWVGSKTDLKKNEDANLVNSVLKNGYHEYTDESGVRFEGDWENDDFIKGKCKYIDEEGEWIVEEGNFNNFNITSGKIVFEDGSVWEGNFDEDAALHGQGKQSNLNNSGEQVIEEGLFEHGLLQQGKIIWADGSIATGTFDEELDLHGEGIFRWPNGDFQEGTWVHGEFTEGKAKITHDDGDVSEGIMKNGEWVEEGDNDNLSNPEDKMNFVQKEIINKETNQRKKYADSIYVGETDPITGNGHGYGAYYWNDGTYYEGEFVQGNFTGTGIYIWPNGRYYAGEFIDDASTGQGREWNPVDETYITGNFMDGMPEEPYEKANENFPWNLSNDLSDFFKTQKQGLDYLQEITAHILHDVAEFKDNNSNELLKSIPCDVFWKLQVYCKEDRLSFGTAICPDIEFTQNGVKIGLESVFSEVAPRMINEISQAEFNTSILKDINLQLNRNVKHFTGLMQEILVNKNDLPIIEMRQGDKVYSNLNEIKGYHPIVIGKINADIINLDSLNGDIRVVFMGLGLIEQSVKKRSVHDQETYWKLTEKGSKMMVDVKMRKLI